MAMLDEQIKCARDATDKAMSSENGCDWDVALECWEAVRRSVNNITERCGAVVQGLQARKDWGHNGEA